MTARGWVPGGDCEHQKNGLDRSPVLGRLFCPKCDREERLRAKAKAQLSGIRRPWWQW